VLRRDGYDFIYSPQSTLQHKIPEGYVSVNNVLRRAYRMGRQGPHINCLPQPNQQPDHPFLWWLRRVAATTYYGLKFLLSHLRFSKTDRVTGAINAMINIGYNTEALRLAAKDKIGGTE
ncbi:MAG: hypothetical protein KC994_26915, partial [Candidatus Omnitrophica bacterium]|nr:hypothetical protein [Candidatus Omnitrophota bacterium]